jgi:hypothetical protein
VAISINWATQVITVPKADTTLVSTGPPEIRSYNVGDTFRASLLAEEDNEIGITYPKTHRHLTEVTVSGITYARVVEIINGYTVEFEDGTYVVRLSGANHNLADVLVPNNVSIVVGNAAGLINPELIDTMASDASTTRKLLDNREVLSDGATGNRIVYDDDDVSVFRTYDISDEGDAAISLGAGDPAKKSKGY